MASFSSIGNVKNTVDNTVKAVDDASKSIKEAASATKGIVNTVKSQIQKVNEFTFKTAEDFKSASDKAMENLTMENISTSLSKVEEQVTDVVKKKSKELYESAEQIVQAHIDAAVGLAVSVERLATGLYTKIVNLLNDLGDYMEESSESITELYNKTTTDILEVPTQLAQSQAIEEACDKQRKQDIITSQVGQVEQHLTGSINKAVDNITPKEIKNIVNNNTEKEKFVGAVIETSAEDLIKFAKSISNMKNLNTNKDLFEKYDSSLNNLNNITTINIEDIEVTVDNE